MPCLAACRDGRNISSTLCITLTALLWGLPCLVMSQPWPSKPIRVVVPWPPGGANDILARALADPLGQALNQTIVVDNRGGSNGMIGAEALARSAPDGHTVMFHSINSHVTNPFVYRNVAYDTIKDFAPVTQITSIPLVVVAHPSFPARNIRDLIGIAKARPGQVDYASFGQGSMSHLAGELLRTMVGIDIVHVPYKGAGPALVDALGGHVPVYFSSIVPALPGIKAGRLRPLAVTSAGRAKQLPDVPAVAETPGLKGYEATIVFGIWAPAKTPPERVERLNGAIQNVIQTPQLRARLETQGAGEPIGGSPQEMAAAIQSEMKKLQRLVHLSGLQPQ